MGRPPKSGYTRKLIALTDETWQRIAEYRHGNMIASEADAVRALIDAGLKVEERKMAKRRGKCQ